MRLATWNVNSIKVREAAVRQWLQSAGPDALALQELKTVAREFPGAGFGEAGYVAEVHGQKTYNGVAWLTRAPLLEVAAGLPEMEDDPQARLIAGTLGDVRLLNVYVPNGESVGSEKYDYKLRWLEALARHLETRYRPDQSLAIVGDFNIAPGERDVFDPVAFAGQVLFSDREHAALRRLLDWGLVDLFRHLHGQEKKYSWWDYRQAAFRRNLGARIDLILVTTPLLARAVSCEIDPGPRKLEKPSDHTPVVAEFR